MERQTAVNQEVWHQALVNLGFKFMPGTPIGEWRYYKDAPLLCPKLAAAEITDKNSGDKMRVIGIRIAKVRSTRDGEVNVAAVDVFDPSHILSEIEVGLPANERRIESLVTPRSQAAA